MFLTRSPGGEDQPDYYVPMINRIATHHAPPDFGTCPAIETPNTKNHFSLGERVYFMVYLRDQRMDHQTSLADYRPDGSVFDTWTHLSDSNHGSSYWYWFNDSLNTEGTWQLTVEYQGVIVPHLFAVGDLLMYGGFGDPL